MPVLCFAPLAVLHMQADVGSGGDLGVVGDDDDAAVLVVREAAQNFDDVTAVLGVEIARRLVGEDQLRP